MIKIKNIDDLIAVIDDIRMDMDDDDEQLCASLRFELEDMKTEKERKAEIFDFIIYGLPQIADDENKEYLINALKQYNELS